MLELESQRPHFLAAYSIFSYIIVKDCSLILTLTVRKTSPLHLSFLRDRWHSNDPDRDETTFANSDLLAYFLRDNRITSTGPENSKYFWQAVKGCRWYVVKTKLITCRLTRWAVSHGLHYVRCLSTMSSWIFLFAWHVKSNSKQDKLNVIKNKLTPYGTHCNISSKRAFPTGVLNRWHNCLLTYGCTTFLVPEFDYT